MNRFVNEFNPEQTDVAICGSMAHMKLWLPIIDELRGVGLTVSTPDLSESANDWSSLADEEIIQKKGFLVRRHIANIATASCILVANFEKNGKENYIGGNTFLEMSAGFVLEKPIYLFNPVPRQDNYEEIMALEPIVLHGDISKIRIQK